MTDPPDIKIITMPMLDTGIGQEAGYENDETFMEAMRQKREALSPEVREAVDAHAREFYHRMWYGDSQRSASTDATYEGTCPQCGSPRWISVSLDGGWTRKPQCVPCGAMHPHTLGLGINHPHYGRKPDEK